MKNIKGFTRDSQKNANLDMKFDAKCSDEIQEALPFNKDGSGEIREDLPFDKDGSGEIQEDLPFDKDGSGEIQEDLPFDKDSSGEIQEDLPFNEDSSGEAQEDLPFNMEQGEDDEEMPVNRTVDNIRYLAKKKNIRLGDIEKSSGASVGYLSRLKAYSDRINISMGFVVRAAKNLGVSTDALMYCDFDKLRPEEEKIYRFMEKACKETEEGKLHWQCITRESMTKPVSSDEMDDIPMLSLGEALAVDENDATYWEQVYKSEFFPDKKIIVRGDAYRYRLEKSEAWLLLTMVGVKQHPQSNDVQNFVEVYIYSIIGEMGVKLAPLCHSLTNVPGFSEITDRLYKAASESSARFYLNDFGRTAIDEFIGEMP